MKLRLVAPALAIAVLASVSAPALATPPPAQPDWITVSRRPGSRPVLVDSHSREVVLRGANMVGAEDDFYTGATTAPQYSINPADYQGTCPAMSHRSAEPPICEVEAGLPGFTQSSAYDSHNDVAQLRSLGMNVIRLTISWSLLEPQPGAYDTTYLDRMAQIVGWAREQGVRVLLDMHQDNYSRYTPATGGPIPSSPALAPTPPSANHADGAPPWAVLTDGEPAVAPGGIAPFNAYVAASFDSFWHNRVPHDAAGAALPTGAAPGAGLQDHYIGAMAALGRRFKNDPSVIGYEIMNEPLSGTTPPVVFSTTELYPFYRRVIDALTGVTDGVACPTGLPYAAVCGYRDLGVHVRRQSFFFEPMVLRDVTDGPDQVPARFSSYPNLVYAPHVYTHVFTADTYAPVPVPYPTSYDQAYQVADAEARAFGAALFVGEFGNSAGQDATLLAGTTAAADRALVGNAVWDWKGQCTQNCSDIWALYSGDPATPPAQNGPLIPSRVAFLSRAYPMATAGHLDHLAYDPGAHLLTMAATASGPVALGHPEAETVVFLPASMKATVTVTGAARLDTVTPEPDGTWRVLVAPTARGAYEVRAA